MTSSSSWQAFSASASNAPASTSPPTSGASPGVPAGTRKAGFSPSTSRSPRRISFALVLDRNVIMCFSPDVPRAVIARIAQGLAPGGFLFLGHAEALRGISQDFQLQHTHETFYYQRRDGADLAGDAPSADFASYH